MSASASVADQDRSEYEPLLHEVALLYERYEAHRKEPFNLFSVLRKSSDEEHLHSKFLAALLNWASPEDGVMENLGDFVQQVVAPAVDTAREEAALKEAEGEEAVPSVEGQGPPEADAGNADIHRGGSPGIGKFSFSLKDARVERERHHIDLLITNAKQAIVIENKIWAADQPRQLQRYFDRVESAGLEPTLVYLTLDGRPPSKKSRGDRVVACLSYKEALIPWLRRCQERACDEPALRESVAQYIALIHTVCGDSGREFMTELKKLLRKGHNLVFAHRLGDAAVDLWIDLLFDFWEGVRRELEQTIGVRKWRIPRDQFSQFVKKRRSGFQHAWPLNDEAPATAWLAFEVKRDGGIFYGVTCNPSKQKQYD